MKYDRIQQTGCLLNANENPKDLDKTLKQAIAQQIMDIEFNRYPIEPDEAFHDLVKQVYQAPACLVGNGSDQLIGHMINLFGQKTLTLAKDFSMYDYYVARNDYEIKKVACQWDGSFSLDEMIEQAKEASLVIFSNPNNPTGHLLTRQEVGYLVEHIHCPIVVDEAYMDFADESILTELKDHVFVTRTLSKAYALAGIRVGFLFGTKKAMASISEAYVPYALGKLSSLAASVVLKNRQAFQADIHLLASQAKELEVKLRQWGYQVASTAANFIYLKASPELIEDLSQHQIQVRVFKEGIRISVGQESEQARLLERMECYAPSQN